MQHSVYPTLQPEGYGTINAALNASVPNTCVVKLSMSLGPQQSQKRMQALVIALLSATLLAACQPNPNPTPNPVPNPSPVPRVPTPSPEPNREPEQPAKPQTTVEITADASTLVHSTETQE